jgi:pimeloyl-ACP methyl ester carboxylesterase
MPGSAARIFVCLHGAGSYASVFDGWQALFPGWNIVAPDLQAGLELSTASMDDYVVSAVSAASVAAPGWEVVLCGWSMGGLVALIAAAKVRPAALVLLEPSLPAELGGVHPEVPLQAGTFDPTEVYGSWPGDPPARLESGWALAERTRGISVPSVRCPLLVVASQTYRDKRGAPVADFYHGELVCFPALHHVSLVTNMIVREAICEWLSRTLA